jgi:hypothetical protein
MGKHLIALMVACGMHDALLPEIAAQGQVLVFRGLYPSTGNMVELFLDPSHGDFSVLATSPDFACITATGVAGEAFAPGVEG